MTIRVFTAVLHKEDDLYVAECPKVGTISQGNTTEKAVANLKEATELYLKEFLLPQVARPLPWSSWALNRYGSAAATSYYTSKS